MQVLQNVVMLTVLIRKVRVFFRELAALDHAAQNSILSLFLDSNHNQQTSFAVQRKCSKTIHCSINTRTPQVLLLSSHATINFVVQSRCAETHSRSSGQIIPQILWNLMVYRRLNKGSPRILFPVRRILVSAVSSFLNIRFNIVIQLTLRSLSLSQRCAPVC